MRQPVAGNGLARKDGHRSAPGTAEIGHGSLGRVDAGDDCFRLLSKNLAGFGQFYPAADTMKQFNVMPVFERVDRPADGRLRQVQCLCRAGYMLSLRDSKKYPQLFECHTTPFKSYHRLCGMAGNLTEPG